MVFRLLLPSSLFASPCGGGRGPPASATGPRARLLRGSPVRDGPMEGLWSKSTALDEVHADVEMAAGGEADCLSEAAELVQVPARRPVVRRVGRRLQLHLQLALRHPGLHQCPQGLTQGEYAHRLPRVRFPTLHLNTQNRQVLSPVSNVRQTGDHQSPEGASIVRLALSQAEVVREVSEPA